MSGPAPHRREAGATLLSRLPFTTGIALAGIATAWPAAGYGALVISAAGDLDATGTTWIFGWPFLVLLLAATAVNLCLLGLGGPLGLPMLTGIAELNRTLASPDERALTDVATLRRAQNAIVRLPALVALVGGVLSIAVTVAMTALEAGLAGGSSPNLRVVARGGLVATALYAVASHALSERLVRPACLRLRRQGLAAGLPLDPGYAMSSGMRVLLSTVPMIVALLVAVEVGESPHRAPGSYLGLTVLTAGVVLGLGWLQVENSSSALKELADACRDLASGRESQLLTGTVDGALVRMAVEFNAAARRVEADRTASSTALQSSLRRLEELYRVAVVMAGRPAELADQIVRAIAELLDVPLATVEILDGDEIVVLSMLQDGELVRGARFPLADTPCAEVRSRRGHCLFTAAAERFPRDAFLREAAIDTYAGVPVIDSRGVVRGVVNVLDRRRRVFRDEDVQLLYTFARRVGVALDEERFDTEREALTARLADQVNALREAQDRLIEHDRVQSEFVGMMSHELRTPLNILLGYTQMLLDDESQDGSVEARGGATGPGRPMTVQERTSLLGRMLRSGHTLYDLVEDTLSVLRLEAGAVHLHLEEVDLASLFDELGTGTQLLEPRPAVVESWTVDPAVPALVTDRRKLRQVIANLAGNARKFTSRGRIEVHASRTGPEAVRIRVRDTGCGIAPEYLPVVFDLYRQAPSELDHDGCGLGLYIVRRYVTMLQGSVECTSTLGEGTVFVVDLPVRAVQPQTAEST